MPSTPIRTGTHEGVGLTRPPASCAHGGSRGQREVMPVFIARQKPEWKGN
jgi:hypothetical protein